MYSLTSLIYTGYPLSAGVLWGRAAGFAKYYSYNRYLKRPGIFTPRSLHAGTYPTFYVVEGATVARESQATIEGSWATTMLARYRGYARVISLPDLMAGLCSTQRTLPPEHNSSDSKGAVIYSLQRTLEIGSARDAVVDTGPARAMGGGGAGCGRAGVVMMLEVRWHSVFLFVDLILLFFSSLGSFLLVFK